jgi:uncharacterized repeat protein (TIGR03806 family)
MTWRYTTLSVAVALALAACGGSTQDMPATPTPVPPPATGGLDARPSNTTCLAPSRPSGPVLSVQRVFPNLSFNAPIALLQAPKDGSRWFVVEQGGTVRTFSNSQSAAAAGTFIDIAARVQSGGELGLLGMAFHPDFPANPRVYLSYTAAGTPLVSRISEFRSADGGKTLDPASEVVLLTVNQPESNHNGGNIAFGPDRFLYIGFGDGGGGGDAHGAIGNGQSLSTLLGKMLRIDVNVASGTARYGIPADNPFASPSAPACNVSGTSVQNCPEIYAYGFRNPWRWSFDSGTGDLWVGDVGEGTWEEADRVTRGGNYGWRCREGAHDYNLTCGPAANLINPVAEYNHGSGQAVTGGYVYRGSAIPALVGRYVFGDYGSGNIWDIARDTAPTLQVTAATAFSSGLNISAFGQDQAGELYAVDYSGTLHELVPAAGSAGTVATQLSATGCADTANATRPASGLIPYAPNAPFWSDGADKERYIGLPNGQRIAVGSDGDFDFPNGSVLVKHFRLGSRLVETRLLMRHPDGVWAGYTYEWNAAQTDATRVIGGKSVQIGNQSWVFPSEAQCLSCHTAAAGRSLGLETAQLNGSLTYSATGRTANQLITLSAIDALTPAYTQDPASLPLLRDPYGTAGTLAERARAYLHTNCSQCHRPGGGTPSAMDLRATTPVSATGACDALPQSGDLGIVNARLIAPGDATRSLIVARAARRDANAMPPIASASVDQAGVALLTSWINGLASCN